MFFAGPACFTCATVWPDFEKTVRVLHRDSENIIFAFVDLSHNELQEEAKIYSFPTIRLYPANTDRGQTWIGYQDNTSYAQFRTFLADHSNAAKLNEDRAELEAAEREE